MTTSTVYYDESARMCRRCGAVCNVDPTEDCGERDSDTYCGPALWTPLGWWFKHARTGYACGPYPARGEAEGAERIALRAHMEARA